MPERLRPGIFYFITVYSSFFPFASSLTTSAAKMTTKPAAILPVSLSPSSRQENAAPNTDSHDRIIDACDAGAILCPIFCRLMAMVVEKTDR